MAMFCREAVKKCNRDGKKERALCMYSMQMRSVIIVGVDRARVCVYVGSGKRLEQSLSVCLRGHCSLYLASTLTQALRQQYQRTWSNDFWNISLLWIQTIDYRLNRSLRYCWKDDAPGMYLQFRVVLSSGIEMTNGWVHADMCKTILIDCHQNRNTNSQTTLSERKEVSRPSCPSSSFPTLRSYSQVQFKVGCNCACMHVYVYMCICIFMNMFFYKVLK